MTRDSEDSEKSAADPTAGRELQSWKFLVFFLCFYGFMNQIRPGESFITPYLLSQSFTQEQITNEIIIVLSYSYTAVLVPIFLLTDYLRYKPVLVLQSLSHIAIWLLLIFGTDILAMQFMEFFYGITMAARVAYSSYIFSLVSPSRYQRMASYSRTSVLLGLFTSSVVGQLCVSVWKVSYITLNYVSLGFVTFGLVLTLFLKPPKRSLFFNRGKPAHQDALPSELDRMNQGSGSLVEEKAGLKVFPAWRDLILVQMLRELKTFLKQPQLRLWSLWWIFNSAGYYLIIYYVHILWSDIDPNRVLNGGVEAASTLLGAITSFTAGYVKIRWTLWSELVIGAVTALQAGLILLMNATGNIWVCYVAYVFFRGFYQFLVPIATFQIASSLSKELCALVFGLNTFFATILKSTITLIVSDKKGLGLQVHSQFHVYFVYFTVLAFAYLGGSVYVALRHNRQDRQQDCPLAKELSGPTEETGARELSPKEGGSSSERA
ncbi:reduced folate transporter [Tachyglossus aculeatus]|uniref:reduced folate transporter n=1 Tax=Tachyglossus aculeatus TaxID=9261 RepID=UPI0018F4ACB4|nr:reduced folate transporter [Tachyglossus aculeatus]XP_038605578.1 reduced folate transporter [Tachyglossus aculeatus]XP_038605579.1 reduced folate transporter [Tachyglossus aculeatus]